MILLEAHNIYKSYDELPVLKGVNLSVNKNEIVSIVGASGAGDLAKAPVNPCAELELLRSTSRPQSKCTSNPETPKLGIGC